jgi:hypothetical protein
MDAKEKSSDTRKVIQFQVVPAGAFKESVVVLCDDGTMWMRMTQKDCPWLLISEVPQPGWDENEFDDPV